MIHLPPIPQDIMYIIILTALCFLYIWKCWPESIASAIKKKDGGGEDLAGGLIWRIAFWVVLFWVVLVIGVHPQQSWLAPDPVIKAIGLTVAIFFTYTMFVPPSFHVVFLSIDPKTGEISKSGKLSVQLVKNQPTPVFVSIYNTGIISWERHRATLQFDDVFELSDSKRASLVIDNSLHYVQYSSSEPITIGGTSASQFSIKSKREGSYRLKVMVNVKGKHSQLTRYLSINVVEPIPDKGDSQKK